MDEEIKKILQQQTEFLKKMSEDIHAMKRATVVGRWVSITMFLLFFVVPLIAGLFLLPPLLQTFSSAYGGGIDIGNIIKNPQGLQQLQQ
ncbi:MAG TPA: hypothetical protein VJC11_01115 [Patescibacteria group bacterium]|nr:hypothetical protein [Patescibacteria group bacterium]